MAGFTASSSKIKADTSGLDPEAVDRLCARQQSRLFAYPTDPLFKCVRLHPGGLFEFLVRVVRESFLRLEENHATDGGDDQNNPESQVFVLRATSRRANVWELVRRFPTFRTVDSVPDKR